MRCYKERVAVIKPSSNKCCSDGSSERNSTIATNTAEVTNMVETAATFQRYMFSEIKIAIKLNAKIRYIM